MWLAAVQQEQRRTSTLNDSYLTTAAARTLLLCLTLAVTKTSHADAKYHHVLQIKSFYQKWHQIKTLLPWSKYNPRPELTRLLLNLIIKLQWLSNNSFLKFTSLQSSCHEHQPFQIFRLAKVSILAVAV